MVQPNKADFGVRKVLKRKKVSKDCMALSERGEFFIKRCKISSDVCFMRLFPARITPLLKTPRISSHHFEVNSKSKLSISPWANRCEPAVIWSSPANNQARQAP
jgi:hypothetical protein